MKFNECLEKAKSCGYELIVLTKINIPWRLRMNMVDYSNYDVAGDNYIFIPDHKAIYTEDENYNLVDKYAEVM